MADVRRQVRWCGILLDDKLVPVGKEERLGGNGKRETIDVTVTRKGLQQQITTANKSGTVFHATTPDDPSWNPREATGRGILGSKVTYRVSPEKES